MIIELSQKREISQMRARVYQHMLATRGWKYRAFLRYLRFFKYAAFAPIRGKFLECYYVLMRFLDDIVDGDAALPKGFQNESDYIMEKIAFSKNPVEPKDEADYLMLYCFELAEKFGEEFHTETEDILNSLLFDADRRGKLIIYPKQKLAEHFHRMDVRGTIKATLKIFKDDPNQYKLLEPLGFACRYQYDIEDIETDLAAGYVNISQEECEQFHISDVDLLDPSSFKIRKWLRQHAIDGLELLDEHHRRLPLGNFSRLARWTFPLVYEYPARKVFKRVLSENN